jgi:hypothetical protein
MKRRSIPLIRSIPLKDQHPLEKKHSIETLLNRLSPSETAVETLLI